MAARLFLESGDTAKAELVLAGAHTIIASAHLHVDPVRPVRVA